MLYFYSFCCLIGKNSEYQLKTCLNYLLKSLDHHVKDYEFIVYTNFNININHPKLIYREYYDKTIDKLYNNVWLNLSFNKINIYKDLYDEKGIDYIWIDLDTIISYDISYLNEVDNFFVVHGGNSERNHWITENDFYVKDRYYIQGAVWKINIRLYKIFMELLKELKSKNLKLCYDLQSLFAYYIYKTINQNVNENGINVLGLNYKPNTINGLGIWSNKSYISEHSNITAFNNLNWHNNILTTNYYPGYEIHFVMFTFDSLFLSGIIDSNKFKEIFFYLQ